MTKGLKSTLLTVAVALLGFNAMATAPTIGSIPDIIIGDAENGSASNVFVYPDALDLDSKVSDDTLAANQIIWSYRTSGSSNYSLNGVGPDTTDLVNPTNRIDNVNNDTYTPQDANTRTITFRNILRTPGPGNANGNGVPDNTSDSQVLTLVASDGSTASTKAFVVYSDNDSPDATSGTQAVVDYTSDFTTGANGWVGITTFVDGRGTMTFNQNANGLCMTVSAQGIQLGLWASEPNADGTPATNYDTVTVVANAVWELRTHITTSGATAGLIPAIQIGFENTQNWFGATYLLLDGGNSGNTPGQYGANAPTPGPLSEYVNYYTPAAFETAEFQAALAAPANAATKNMRVKLGLIDSDGGGGAADSYGAGSDVGTVCFRDIVMNRYDAAAMQTVATHYDEGTLSDAVEAAAGSPSPTAGGLTADNFSRTPANTNVNFTNGDLVVTPASNTAWDPPTGVNDGAAEAFVQARLGDRTLTTVAAGSGDMTDNFPIPWVTGRLYKMTYYMYAPNQLGQDSPPDFFYVSGFVLSNELINTSFMTTKFGNAGMPNTGAAQPYSVLFYTNNQTLEPNQWRGIGSQIQIGCVKEFVDNAQGANFTLQNQGGIALDRITITEVSF